jgi:uncharacterized protein YjbJ (UPF0337 family)
MALIRARGTPRATPQENEKRCRTKESVMGLGKKVKDSAKIVKGKTKKDAGKATGNNRLKVKGKASEVTGKLKLKGERAKDVARKH